jgi:type IV pilus assembly protein PilN
MIKINLLPREEKPSREIQTWGRILVWSLIGAAIVVLVGIGMHIFRAYEIAALKSDIAETRRELAKYEGQAALVRDLTARRKSIEDRLDVIGEIDRDRFLRVYLLDELARAVPDYVWLESCDEKDGAINLKGQAFSNLAISQFMDHLGAEAHADSVSLLIIRKDEVENQPVLGFEIGYKFPKSQIGVAHPPKPPIGKSREGAKSS